MANRKENDGIYAGKLTKLYNNNSDIYSNVNNCIYYSEPFVVTKFLPELRWVIDQLNRACFVRCKSSMNKRPYSSISSANENGSYNEHEKELIKMKAPKMVGSDSTSVTLAWESVPGAAGYRLRWCKQQGGASAEWIESSSLIIGTEVRKKNLETGIGYRFSVKPEFKQDDTQQPQKEIAWSRPSDHCVPFSYTPPPPPSSSAQGKKKLTIATWNIAGLPSFINNVFSGKMGIKNRDDAFTSSTIMQTFCNTHNIDILCLQEVKGDKKEWETYRRGEPKTQTKTKTKTKTQTLTQTPHQGGESPTRIGKDKGTYLLSLKDIFFEEFVFCPASVDGEGLIGNTAMLIRKAVFTGEAPTNRLTEFHTPARLKRWTSSTEEGKAEYKAGEGRYQEYRINDTIVLINLYVYACSSYKPQRRDSDIICRRDLCQAVMNRINLLRKCGTRVILAGDLNSQSLFLQDEYSIDCLRDVINLASSTRFTWWDRGASYIPSGRLTLPNVPVSTLLNDDKQPSGWFFNRLDPHTGNAYMGDRILADRSLQVVSPPPPDSSDLNANLKMFGCKPSCPVPCLSDECALKASRDSIKLPFPFPHSPLIIYTSVAASDHVVVHCTFLV